MSDSDFVIFYESLSEELKIIFIGGFVFVAVLIFVISVKLYQFIKKKRQQKQLQQQRDMQVNNSIETPAYSTPCEAHSYLKDLENR